MRTAKRDFWLNKGNDGDHAREDINFGRAMPTPLLNDSKELQFLTLRALNNIAPGSRPSKDFG